MANFIAQAAVRKEQFATKTGNIGYPQVTRLERQIPRTIDPEVVLSIDVAQRLGIKPTDGWAIPPG
jgi:hypothetical protein